MAPKRRSVAGNCALEGWERSLCRVGEVDAIASFIKYGLQFPVPFLLSTFALTLTQKLQFSLIWGWQVPMPSRNLGYKGSSRGTQRLLNSAGMVLVLREH
jgi:hypothetical protein